MRGGLICVDSEGNGYHEPVPVPAGTKTSRGISMGKAARLKAERRRVTPPPPVGKPLHTSSRAVWWGTGALLVVIGIVVGVLVGTRSTTKTPSAAAPSAADRNAPASLVAAANAVGFYPTTEPGAGATENRPASAAKPPYSHVLLPVGSQAPDFALKTPEGQTIRLADYRGKVVLLEFFATWCPHCNAEAPHLERIYRSLPKSRYAFLSVNADSEDAASVFAYHRYYGLTFPALLDPGSIPGSFHKQGSSGPVTTRYGLGAYPTFYVIDGHGRITWRSDGEQPDALLRQELARAARG
jgi:peroxiredoxin